jgi:predicted short-subunit dehydrogenase-like oxidoreductase (DUF2520 family)
MIHKKLTIVGPGKVGTVLGKRLQQNNYEIVSIIGKNSSSTSSCAEFLNCNNFSTSIEDISSRTNLILISVPDSEIKNVSRKISENKKLKFKELTVFHTSGALSASILSSLGLKGSKIFSIHPFQTFASVSSVLNNMEGVFYGIEGQKSVLKIASNIVQDLGGNPVIIPSSLKPLYHAAGVLASNYYITFVRKIYSIFKELKINPTEYNRILKPIMSQSLENLEKLPEYNAITGPISRGDSSTIEMHLNSIDKNIPSLNGFYILMGNETLQMCYSDGKITDAQFKDIKEVFSKYSKNANLKERE